MMITRIYQEEDNTSSGFDVCTGLNWINGQIWINGYFLSK